MPTQRFSTTYTTQSNSVVSAADVKTNELFGVDLVDSFGNPMPESAIEQLIDDAVAEVESTYTIKMVCQVIDEQKNFRLQDLKRNRFINLTYPFLSGVGVRAQINNISMIVYDRSTMVSTRPNEANGGPDVPRRNVHILPSANGVDFNQVTSGYSVQLDSFYLGNNNYYGAGISYDSLPAGWAIQYITPGYGDDPLIKKFIRKQVAMELLGSVGENVGQGVGIASKTIGLDGLSSSVATTSSATSSTFGARIKQIADELKGLQKVLAKKYLGIQVNKF